MCLISCHNTLPTDKSEIWPQCAHTQSNFVMHVVDLFDAKYCNQLQSKVFMASKATRHKQNKLSTQILSRRAHFRHLQYLWSVDVDACFNVFFLFVELHWRSLGAEAETQNYCKWNWAQMKNYIEGLSLCDYITAAYSHFVNFAFCSAVCSTCVKRLELIII